MFKFNSLKQLDIFVLKGTIDKNRYIIYYGPYYEVGKIIINKEDKLYIDLVIYELVNNKYKYEDILTWILDAMGLFNYNIKTIVINGNEYINPYYEHMSIMEKEYTSYIEYLNNVSTSWNEEISQNSTQINGILNKKSKIKLTFNYNGEINFIHESNPSNNYYNFRAFYNVKRNSYDLSLRTKGKNGNYRYIRVSDDTQDIQFRENDNKIIYNKDSEVISYCGLKRVGNNINMFLDTKVKDNKVIESTINICLLNFNIFYKIHIGGEITIEYIDNSKNEVIFSKSLFDESLNLLDLDILIKKLIDEVIIPTGVNINSGLLTNVDIVKTYDICLNALKQINGDIKLPYLKGLINYSMNKNEKVLVNKLQ